MASTNVDVRSESPQAKRARVSEPVDEKVAENMSVLHQAFEDEEQLGVASLPAPCREMLKTLMAPAFQASASERCSLQTKVAKSVGEVLGEVQNVWEGRCSDVRSQLESSGAIKAEKAAASEATKGTLQACLGDIKSKQKALDLAREEVSSASDKVDEAEGDQVNCEMQKESKEKARKKVSSIFEENFATLKACDWPTPDAKAKGEKKLFGPLATLLRSLNADSSLVDALPATFAKKPEERGEFDHLALRTLEELMTKHLAGIDEWLSNFDQTLAEKKAAITEKKTECDAAKLRQTDHEGILKAAKGALFESFVAKKGADRNVQEHETLVQELYSDETLKAAGLDKAKQTLSAFTFLNERVPPVHPVAAM